VWARRGRPERLQWRARAAARKAGGRARAAGARGGRGGRGAGRGGRSGGGVDGRAGALMRNQTTAPTPHHLLYRHQLAGFAVLRQHHAAEAACAFRAR
jgi:hypothetical protein